MMRRLGLYNVTRECRTDRAVDLVATQFRQRRDPRKQQLVVDEFETPARAEDSIDFLKNNVP